MNIITIKKISDLQTLIPENLYISGSKSQLQKEIDCNMWCLAFTSNSIEKITIQDLSQFFDSLIANKKKQLYTNKPFLPALFYVWFDQQAFQLRFNCISNLDNKLPFKSKLMLLDSPVDIFKDLLTTTRDFFKNGDTIEFFDSTEEEDDDDDEESKFMLSVFVERIDL